MDQQIQKEIISYFPIEIQKELLTQLKEKIQDILEIRIRVGQAMMLRFLENDLFLEHVISLEEMKNLLENFCHRSIYSSQIEINQGFLTLSGGHRIGISGSCVLEKNEMKNMKEISSMNIRIAREIKGCSIPILTQIVKQNSFKNTLILSPPGCGKTTILRDMIRNLSDGYKMLRGKEISLIDERSEIASMYKGVPQKDIGKRTDVMSNIPKWLGIKMMIRSMGPEIIATDEIGSKEDMEAIDDAVHAGIQLLLTMHGERIEDIPFKLRNGIFQYIVILEKRKTPGMMKGIYRWEDQNYVLCA